jgi:hypothetical protein
VLRWPIVQMHMPLIKRWMAVYQLEQVLLFSWRCYYTGNLAQTSISPLLS